MVRVRHHWDLAPPGGGVFVFARNRCKHGVISAPRPLCEVLLVCCLLMIGKKNAQALHTAPPPFRGLHTPRCRKFACVAQGPQGLFQPVEVNNSYLISRSHVGLWGAA